MSLDSWNAIRRQLNSGSGALYKDDSVPRVGESAVETMQSVTVGIYFFFLSVDPTDVRSVRQWLVLPEVLLVLYMMPSLYRGFWCVMRHHRFEFLSVLLVAAAITLAYSAATTNAGPLLRCRRADSAQGRSGTEADTGVLVLQGFDQGGHGVFGRRTDLAQGISGR